MGKWTAMTKSKSDPCDLGETRRVLNVADTSPFEQRYLPLEENVKYAKIRVFKTWNEGRKFHFSLPNILTTMRGER
jgi:hypothetical protein